jgi:hypothetical protein
MWWTDAHAELEAGLREYPPTHSDRRYFHQMHQSIAGIRADLMTHHPAVFMQETP